MTPLAYVVAGLILLAMMVSLCGFWLFFTRVVGPMIPRRFVPNPETTYQGIGESLPFLELEPLTGDSRRLSLPDLDDNVVLLSFWGTWCRPCRSELPHIAALRQRFAGQKMFRLVAISYPVLGRGNDLQSLREETAGLLQQLNLELPTYWDPDDVTRSALDQVVGFQGFPTTVLLGRHGVIRAIWVGYRPGVETEMERYIDKALSNEEK